MIMENTALIIIDIQNIYFTKGPYLLDQPEKALKQAKKVLDEFRIKKLPVIHVKHEFHLKDYDESNEYLNRIHEILTPTKDEKIVTKKCPNAFLGTDLLEYLQQLEIKQLVIVGMMSHMCVDTTVRACQDYGYQVTVLEDACTTMSLSWNGKEMNAATVHAAYMAGLKGAFAKVIKTDEFSLEAN